MIPDNLEFAWQSDFNGDEVGFPEVLVVGIYNLEAADGTYTFMIDTGTGQVLSISKMDEE